MAEIVVPQCQSCWMQGEEITANDILLQLFTRHPDLEARAGESLAGGLVGNETLSNQEMCGLSLIAQVIANNLELEPSEKRLLIDEAQKSADEKNCPHLKDVNSDYPGSHSL